MTMTQKKEQDKQDTKLIIMKTINQKPAVSKLVAQFDAQLKEIIMNDLKMLRGAKSQFLRAIKNEQLSVA